MTLEGAGHFLPSLLVLLLDPRFLVANLDLERALCLRHLISSQLELLRAFARQLVGDHET